MFSPKLKEIRWKISLKLLPIAIVIGIGGSGLYEIAKLTFDGSPWFETFQSFVSKHPMEILGLLGLPVLAGILYFTVLGPFLPNSYWEEWEKNHIKKR